MYFNYSASLKIFTFYQLSFRKKKFFIWNKITSLIWNKRVKLLEELENGFNEKYIW